MVPFVPAHVERDDSHVVTGHQIKILFAVIQCECEDTVQLFQKIDPFFAVQCKDYLAVRAGQEFILACKLLAQLPVVVNLSVDGQNQFSVFAFEGLSSRFGIYDRESFVGEDCVCSAINARPVGAPVADFPGHFQYLGSETLRVGRDVKHPDDSTHRCLLLHDKVTPQI